MNQPKRSSAKTCRGSFGSWAWKVLWTGFALAIGSLATTSLQAEASVQTLGGGRLSPNGTDYGFTDGDTLQVSQFHTPAGCAVDASGRIYVADRDNGALRRIDLSSDRCRTVLTGLVQPVAVAIDTNNIVYVLSQGDGSIQRLDRGFPSLLTGSLSSPTAMAYDGAVSLFVTQSDGSVVRVHVKTGAITPTALHGLNSPGGIAVLDSGFVAVSETGAHQIRILDPNTGTAQLRIGAESGLADGPAEHARFNSPHQLAKTPAGTLIVADRGNHRVRLIDLDGFVSTIYGVDSRFWEGPACTTCNPIILPGWLDGPAEFAESREPVGVAVASDGNLYTTEAYYHLVRKVTDALFTGGSGGAPGSTNANTIVVLPPQFTPSSGYFPMGRTIQVADQNPNNLLPAAVYYTTDGTEPTTSSHRVSLVNGRGSIFFQEKQHDLRSLRLRSFLGTNSSEIVSGQPVSVTEIGVPQDFVAGMGSTAIIPVVVNLRTNDKLQSIQFRVEVTPESPGAPPLPDAIQALPISTNDFIVLYSEETKGVAMFNYATYQVDQTRGIAIAFIGTNANFIVKSYGVVAMVSVPIPSTAKSGDRYRVDVVNPSGTSDAFENRVEFSLMAPRSIQVRETHYLVGDSSISTWYNAMGIDDSGELRRGFGDGLLDNADVNNAFAAALGLRVPYEGSDIFNSLDAYPEDTAAAAGGDGFIRFLDWQIILERSLGLQDARWERIWTGNGLSVMNPGRQGGLADLPGETVEAPGAGSVWYKQVELGAPSVTQILPGVPFDVPVYVSVAPGLELAGLAFRAVVQPDGAAPALATPLQFIPNPAMPTPPQNAAPSPSVLLCGWPLVPSSSFDPPLRGSNTVGLLRVTLPATARPGQSYTLRFANADGSPDLHTQYDFETRPGTLWVLSDALHTAPATSEEWKTHFFGNSSSSAAADDADPDHDGVSNAAEFLAGTDPTNGDSRLHLAPAEVNVPGKSVTLSWLSAPGKTYRIEAASNLASPKWTVLAENLPGDGRVQKWTQNNCTSTTQFYRISLQR